MNVAIETRNQSLCKDCAIILESMKQYPEAATMYESALLYEKAAGIYIQLKNLSKATPLMRDVSSSSLIQLLKKYYCYILKLFQVTAPKLHIQFAKAKEAVGDFTLAAKSYEAASDIENLVRLYLEQLKDPLKGEIKYHIFKL